MGLVISDKQYRADMEELFAYRSTGMKPEEIMVMKAKHSDPAPLPLPLYAGDAPPWDDDGFSVAAGIPADDRHDPALEAQEAYQEDRWTK